MYGAEPGHARAPRQRRRADDHQNSVRLVSPQHAKLNADAARFLPAHDAGKTQVGGRPRQPHDDYDSRAKWQQLGSLDEGPADAQILGHPVERWTTHALAPGSDFDPRSRLR